MVNPPDGSDRRWCRLIWFFRKLIIPTSLPFLGYEEPSNEIRSNLLVAAALIAAVTFQAGVAPPGGVWQDDEKGRVAGRSIYSSQRVPFYVFLICNTLAFSSSIHLLLCLTFGYPYFLEVLAATASMAGTYAAAIFCVTPNETVKFRLISLVAVLPIMIRPLIWSLFWTIGAISSFCSKHKRGDEAVRTAES